MAEIDQLLSTAQTLLAQESPSTSEIRNVMIDLDDVINSAEFAGLEPEQRAKLQSTYQDLRGALREKERPAGQRWRCGRCLHSEGWFPSSLKVAWKPARA